MSSLLTELSSLRNAAFSDETQRKQLSIALKEASLAIETPLETVHRLTFQPLQLAVLKIASDLKLFSILVNSSAKSMGSQELAQMTGSSPELLVRLLRYLASLSMIDQIAEDEYGPTKMTRALAQAELEAGILIAFDYVMPCLQAFPEYLARNKYENPSDNAHTAFGMAHKTDLPIYDWVRQQPVEKARLFALWMQATKAGSWLDAVPFENFCSSSDPETPIFVDIGGSLGHQCAILKEKYPKIPGRIIYQDMAPVISRGLKIPEVEGMVHDFWQEQSIKGARVYYLRMILHDYPDEKCVKLLKNTAAAMNEQSVILIDELILSEYKPYYRAAEMDLTMMLNHAAAERTEKQWRALTAAAGLKIKDIFFYNKEMGNGVIALQLE